MKLSDYRCWQSAILILSIGVLISAYAVGYTAHVSPCPLCLMQRWCVMSLLLITAIAMGIKSSRGRLMLISLQGVLVIGGLYFAGRQWWLQLLPPEQQAACLPDWDILVQYFPWRDILRTLFLGAPDCGVVSWRLWGLSMAQWSFVYFLTVLLLIVIVFFCARRAAR